MNPTHASRTLLIGGSLLAAAYVAACSEEHPTSPELVSIQAAKGGGGPKVKVDATDPPGAEQSTFNLNVTVTGSGFEDDAQATFTHQDDPDGITTNSTTFVSSSKLVANIDVANDALVALWDVEVRNFRSGRKGIGSELFDVCQKGCGKPRSGIPYDVTDLGALPPNSRSRAWGMSINGLGQIQLVGSSWDRQDVFDDPTLWTVDVEGGVTVAALGMPPGADGDQDYAAPKAITSTGIAVGTSSVGPVYWDASGANLLPVGAGVSGGRAEDVALLGGGAVIIVGSRDTSPREAVVWLDFVLQPALPPHFDGAPSAARAVNSQGTVAGYSYRNAVVWHNTGGNYQVCDLGSGTVYGISEPPSTGLVHVAGASDISEHHATVWTVDLVNTTWGSSCALAAPPRRLGFYSEFLDVNAQGDAVGNDLLAHHAILWTGTGELVDLPSLPKGASAGAAAVNADGTRIAGLSQGAKRTTRAVLWTRKE